MLTQCFLDEAYFVQECVLEENHEREQIFALADQGIDLGVWDKNVVDVYKKSSKEARKCFCRWKDHRTKFKNVSRGKKNIERS